MKLAPFVVVCFIEPRTRMQVQPSKADHMRRNTIMYLRDFSDDQRIGEVRKEKEYLRTALRVMRVKLLSSVMTAMRNCCTTQFYYPKTSSCLPTSFGAEDLQNTKRPNHEKTLPGESGCFEKSSDVDLKK